MGHKHNTTAVEEHNNNNNNHLGTIKKGKKKILKTSNGNRINKCRSNNVSVGKQSSLTIQTIIITTTRRRRRRVKFMIILILTIILIK